jgi:hypothetical protein
MCCVMSCLDARGLLFPLTRTLVSRSFYGSLSSLVTQTCTGHAKGELFRPNRRAAGYSPLGPGGLQMPVSSHAARSPR